MERLNLLRCRRDSVQVEGRPPDQRDLVGWGTGCHAALGQPGSNERIHRAGVLHPRDRRRSDGLKRPVIPLVVGEGRLILHPSSAGRRRAHDGNQGHQTGEKPESGGSAHSASGKQRLANRHGHTIRRSTLPLSRCYRAYRREIAGSTATAQMFSHETQTVHAAQGALAKGSKARWGSPCSRFRKEERSPAIGVPKPRR